MRGLIIGFGSIGRRHAMNVRLINPDAELILLRQALQAPPAELSDAAVVATLKDAVAARPDFAVVANPSSYHAETIAPLLSAGIPCYIEKPVVTSRQDLTRLQEFVTKHPNPPTTMVGCNLRFLPSLQKLRELVHEGRIGNVVRGNMQVGQWLPDWRPKQDYRTSYSADPARGGGVIFDLIHELDAARWLFGEFRDVKAMAGKLSRLDIASEDTACILLSGVGGKPILSINLDYVSRKSIRRYDIVGDAGTISWDLVSRHLDVVDGEGSKTYALDNAAFDVSKTYMAAMTEFFSCIAAERPTSQDLREGLASADLALRAREAAGL